MKPTLTPPELTSATSVISPISRPKSLLYTDPSSVPNLIPCTNPPDFPGDHPIITLSCDNGKGPSLLPTAMSLPVFPQL